MESMQEANFSHENEEEMEVDEQDRTQTQTTHNTSSIGGSGRAKRKRKETALRSPAWEDFEVVTVKEVVDGREVDKRKGKCHRCGTLIAADSEMNGTTGLRKHTKSCKAKYEQKDGQTKLTFRAGDGEGSGILSSWKFSQKEARIALCEMIILDELPFRFVEKEGFNKFCRKVCPDFKVPSRQTIREDCVKLFVENKKTLKAFFKKKGMGRVSITTDCWTAINNTNFICVTAHFITKDWTLHKKIIGFRKIVGHKGEEIGEAIVEVLKDWDLKSILCCTVDNASANDGAVRYVGKYLDLWNTSMLGGKYLHLRCVAHIINLVVSDGLEDIGVSVARVREVVKWIRGSPKREHEFYKCASSFLEGSQKGLCLDVTTRWNSTYLMLESAEPYHMAIKVYASVNSSFVADLNSKMHDDIPLGPPEDEDWVNVRKMIDYLKTFYDFTLLFSGTSYVTSHLFFKEMCDIFEVISELERSRDEEVVSMAKKMKEKIGKYWLEKEDLNPKINKLLYIAAILDPRQKLKHVETCLTHVYGGARATTLLIYLKELMHELFNFYKMQQQQQTPTPAAATQPSQSQSSSSVNTQQRQRFRSKPRHRGSCRIIPRSSQSSDDDMSELTIYYSEPQHVEETSQTTVVEDDDDAIDKFDILQWWSKDGARYRVLSDMARDILAVPISTVASESAFSMGGRVLDQFRSSLNPDMVEALICSSDWLRSSSTFLIDEEDVPEEELQKEFDAVMVSLGFGKEATQDVDGTGTSTSTSMINVD